MPLSDFENKIVLGNCADVLRLLPDGSIDAIVSDPPYGIGTKEPTPEEIERYLSGGRLDTGGDFMGKDWEIPPVGVWMECLRVLKPGGYCLSFSSTRTWDLMSLGLRAAGLTDEDTFASKFGASMLQWVQGQGFPKSLNVSKKIDELLGAERKVVGKKKVTRILNPEDVKKHNYAVGVEGRGGEIPVTEAASDLAKKWEGWGTALKPSWEPVLVFRKPGKPLVTPEINAPFFYTAKATKGETHLKKEVESIENTHPTRKPLALMRWLVSLVVPKGGIVVDPYCGSGSTCHAALEEGMRFIGVELDPVFHKIARKRCEIIDAKVSAIRGQEDLFALAFGGDE